MASYVGPAHLLVRVLAQYMQQRRVEGIPVDFTSFENTNFWRSGLKWVEIILCWLRLHTLQREHVSFCEFIDCCNCVHNGKEVKSCRSELERDLSKTFARHNSEFFMVFFKLHHCTPYPNAFSSWSGNVESSDVHPFTYFASAFLLTLSGMILLQILPGAVSRNYDWLLEVRRLAWNHIFEWLKTPQILCQIQIWVQFVRFSKLPITGRRNTVPHTVAAIKYCALGKVFGTHQSMITNHHS